MPVPPIHVIAARESGGGGAVSSVSVMAEPPAATDEHAAAAMQEAIRVLDPIPTATAGGEEQVDPEPAGEEMPPFAAATQIEWGPASAAPPETASPIPEDTVSQVLGESEQKKKGGLFASWFRPRSRDGVTH